MADLSSTRNSKSDEISFYQNPRCTGPWPNFTHLVWRHLLACDIVWWYNKSWGLAYNCATCNVGGSFCHSTLITRISPRGRCHFHGWKSKRKCSNCGINPHDYAKGGRGPLDFWVNENQCGFFTKRTIKVCISCDWPCPGPSTPSVPHQTVPLNFCILGSNLQGEIGRPLRTPCQLKKPMKGQKQRHASCRERRMRLLVSHRLVCHLDKSMIFHPSGLPKIWLVARLPPFNVKIKTFICTQSKWIIPGLTNLGLTVFGRLLQHPIFHVGKSDPAGCVWTFFWNIARVSSNATSFESIVVEHSSLEVPRRRQNTILKGLTNQHFMFPIL